MEASSQTLEEKSVLPLVNFLNPKKGSADVDAIVLVVFSDFQCQACKELANTLNTLLQTVPDVRIAWKNMPNETSHPLAVSAAVAAHCAGQQGKFWEYHDALFEQQALLTETSLASLADTLKLDTTKFQRCFQEKETLPLVEKDLEEALALRIAATPAIFIGEDRFVGALSLDALTAAVARARNARL